MTCWMDCLDEFTTILPRTKTCDRASARSIPNIPRLRFTFNVKVQSNPASNGKIPAFDGQIFDFHTYMLIVFPYAPRQLKTASCGGLAPSETIAWRHDEGRPRASRATRARQVGLLAHHRQEKQFVLAKPNYTNDYCWRSIKTY